ncbi:hypothetical protein [Streptomyces sp. NPDC059166]
MLGMLERGESSSMLVTVAVVLGVGLVAYRRFGARKKQETNTPENGSGV